MLICLVLLLWFCWRLVYTDVIIIVNYICLLYVRAVLDAMNCVYLKPLVSVMGSYDSFSSFISSYALLYFCQVYVRYYMGRSQWPRGLRRRSTAARLLRSWVRIPPGTWTFVCCVLSGRGLCDELITRPEESYRLWYVVVCGQVRGPQVVHLTA
jgi:hypothetical protein